ncbi:glycosyltransferase [bacterium]|nr:glycosyltransferase [bacterium]MCI0606186.1 glycosyltransferase [bacterium]
MEENCRITALMPLKNYHLPYVRKAIESLQKQSSPFWKLLIIVEDRDYPRLSSLLQNELADSRIRMIQNEARKLAGAFNTGMRRAETVFVGILLSDDMWSTDAVAVLNANIGSQPHADFFHSSRMIIDEEDRQISSVYYSKDRFSIEDFLRTSPVKHLLCWRVTKALSFGGMDETLNSVGPDDYDFPWLMAENGAIFVAIKECLYLYRDHRDSYRLTTHLPLSVHEEEIRKIMRKHGASPSAIEKKISRARVTYLRQCLYKSRFEKWVRETSGAGSLQNYREKYK